MPSSSKENALIKFRTSTLVLDDSCISGPKTTVTAPIIDNDKAMQVRFHDGGEPVSQIFKGR